ncbi:MAG TPA: DUF6204 family protein [Actinocrinis sp.]
MFRVTIRGTFEAPVGEDDALPIQTDALQAAFTEAGTFSCDPGLTFFTFRCQVAAGPDDGQEQATEHALRALAAYGVPLQIMRIAVTDTRDIRVRRKGPKK